MFNFNRGEEKSTEKPAPKPAPYPYAPTPAVTQGKAAIQSSAGVRTTPAPAAPAAAAAVAATAPAPGPAGSQGFPPAPVLTDSVARIVGPDTPGSQLVVGPNIKLHGMEVSDCDVLIVEGQVEATVNSKAMRIAKSGTLKGIALIDVAEIDGEFSGELTAQATLVVRGTGRVSGKIRYGRLIVAEGGEVSGDVQRIDAAKDVSSKRETAAPVARPQLSPQPPG